METWSRREKSCQVATLRGETGLPASAFVSHLDTARVMRWLNELHTRHREFCSGSVAGQGMLRVLWHPLGRGSLWGSWKYSTLCQTGMAAERRRRSVSDSRRFNLKCFTHGEWTQGERARDDMGPLLLRCGWHIQHPLIVTSRLHSQSAPRLPGPLPKGPYTRVIH